MNSETFNKYYNNEKLVWNCNICIEKENKNDQSISNNNNSDEKKENIDKNKITENKCFSEIENKNNINNNNNENKDSNNNEVINKGGVKYMTSNENIYI
jgi:hypothetical protein